MKGLEQTLGRQLLGPNARGEHCLTQIPEENAAWPKLPRKTLLGQNSRGKRRLAQSPEELTKLKTGTDLNTENHKFNKLEQKTLNLTSFDPKFEQA